MIANNKKLFDKAQQYYHNGDYQRALQTYEQIPAKNAAVWNNMANAAYNTGDSLHAQLYWLRAQKNSSGSIYNLVRHNQTIAHVPCNFSYMQQLQASFYPLFFQILFFCLFSVFFIIVARYMRQKKYALLCILSILSMASGTVTYQIYREQKNKYGLIMPDLAAVYIGPETSYHPLGQIAQGTHVLLCDKKNGWAQVAWDKKIGWISTSDIEII